MIKLNFFYPFSNLLRATVEFHDETARVKTKSLSHEREFEFHYDQVATIMYQSFISESQLTFSVVVLVIIAFAFALFYPIFYARPLLLQALRVLYLLSTLLVLFSFFQRRSYYFLDKDQQPLLGMKVNARNYAAVMEAVERVAQKAGNARETTFENPFPEAEPLFEITDLDLPNYFTLSRTRFYEEEFIQFSKGLSGMTVEGYRYDQLSSTIDRLKKTSTSWDTLLGAIWVIFMFLAGAYRAFAIPKTIFFSLAAVLAVLWVISLVLKFVKHEIIAFWDKNDRVVYFMWVTRSNKEKVEAIVQFIRSKIPAEGH